uniref:hypothetical protein n=1 Tax=Bradyrhizobium guangxiense TaxID=1325115 RepID=UPI0037039B2C
MTDVVKITETGLKADWIRGNALPRVRRFRLSGKKPAKEPAVKKRSDATALKPDRISG